jgi:hypothetical protein
MYECIPGCAATSAMGTYEWALVHTQPGDTVKILLYSSSPYSLGTGTFPEPRAHQVLVNLANKSCLWIFLISALADPLETHVAVTGFSPLSSFLGLLLFCKRNPHWGHQAPTVSLTKSRGLSLWVSWPFHRAEYQVPCATDVCITIHDRTKIILTK